MQVQNSSRIRRVILSVLGPSAASSNSRLPRKLNTILFHRTRRAAYRHDSATRNGSYCAGYGGIICTDARPRGRLNREGDHDGPAETVYRSPGAASGAKAGMCGNGGRVTITTSLNGECLSTYHAGTAMATPNIPSAR